jgi:hypothetical protein
MAGYTDVERSGAWGNARNTLWSLNLRIESSKALRTHFLWQGDGTIGDSGLECRRKETLKTFFIARTR